MLCLQRPWRQRVEDSGAVGSPTKYVGGRQGRAIHRVFNNLTEREMVAGAPVAPRCSAGSRRPAPSIWNSEVCLKAHCLDPAFSMIRSGVMAVSIVDIPNLAIDHRTGFLGAIYRQ